MSFATCGLVYGGAVWCTTSAPVILGCKELLSPTPSPTFGNMATPSRPPARAPVRKRNAKRRNRHPKRAAPLSVRVAVARAAATVVVVAAGAAAAAMARVAYLICRPAPGRRRATVTTVAARTATATVPRRMEAAMAMAMVPRPPMRRIRMVLLVPSRAQPRVVLAALPTTCEPQSVQQNVLVTGRLSPLPQRHVKSRPPVASRLVERTRASVATVTICRWTSERAQTSRRMSTCRERWCASIATRWTSPWRVPTAAV
mmetsp:Transcript_21042/g.53968  ORF Transcript_21042/g.53968 Transcript_21042/m.53968 type:complete len:258 (-) Transcript_21042:885-1658(-)